MAQLKKPRIEIICSIVQVSTNYITLKILEQPNKKSKSGIV